MKLYLGFRKNKNDFYCTVYAKDNDTAFALLQTLQDGNALVFNSRLIDEEKKDDSAENKTA